MPCHDWIMLTVHDFVCVSVHPLQAVRVIYVFSMRPFSLLRPRLPSEEQYPPPLPLDGSWRMIERAPPNLVHIAPPLGPDIPASSSSSRRSGIHSMRCHAGLVSPQTPVAVSSRTPSSTPQRSSEVFDARTVGLAAASTMQPSLGGRHECVPMKQRER